MHPFVDFVDCTASSKDHFFSKSTEEEKHSEGELKKNSVRVIIMCKTDEAH